MKLFGFRINHFMVAFLIVTFSLSSFSKEESDPNLGQQDEKIVADVRINRAVSAGALSAGSLVGVSSALSDIELAKRSIEYAKWVGPNLKHLYPDSMELAIQNQALSRKVISSASARLAAFGAGALVGAFATGYQIGDFVVDYDRNHWDGKLVGGVSHAMEVVADKVKSSKEDSQGVEASAGAQ